MSTATLIERLQNFEVNSSVARQVLSVYYKEGKRYRLWAGPLLGMTLEYDANVNYHVILGLWEAKSYRFLRRFFRDAKVLRRGMVVADLGANLGYFSLWMHRLLEPLDGKVVAFEPSPSILPMLRRNLRENAARTVKLAEIACSDADGEVEFFVGDHHHISSLVENWASQGRSHISADRRVVVPSTTLDSYFFEGPGKAVGSPDLIKIDIEGGGVFALKGMDRCLTSKRPLIWMESHTPHEDRAISDLLLKHDYQAYRLQTKSLVSERGKVHPHPAGVWGTLLLFPREKTSALKWALDG